METLVQILTIGFYMIIPVGVLALMINIVYRRIKGKSWFNSGTSFVGENIYMEWDTLSKRKAIEEVQYEREDKRNDAESGDPPEPGTVDIRKLKKPEAPRTGGSRPEKSD